MRQKTNKGIQKWRTNATRRVGRESWSSDYGRRLIFESLWVWIPALYTGWTWHFSHWLLFEKTKNKWKRGQVGPLLEKKPKEMIQGKFSHFSGKYVWSLTIFWDFMRLAPSREIWVMTHNATEDSALKLQKKYRVKTPNRLFSIWPTTTLEPNTD